MMGDQGLWREPEERAIQWLDEGDGRWGIEVVVKR